MSRYITIVFTNGIVKSIPINYTMCKAQKFVECLNEYEIRRAYITDKDGYEIKQREERK